MKKNLFLLLLILFCSCTEKHDTQSQTQFPDIGYNQFLSNIKLPEKLDFCGERIPLEIEEVRERAEREFYLLLQQPGQVILYLKRSGRYFPIFEQIIKESGMPDDLKYLSVAESALYMSRSPKDALGLWQFIPETARRCGLQVDEFVDERCHPEKSTRAAMIYLQQGYRQHGSWLMAAAGYNMGHGNLADNVDFQYSKDYFDLFLNEETSRYILRIAIIKELMVHPEKYGFNLSAEDLYKPAKGKIVKVTSEIDNLSAWAKSQGTTYKSVKLLNPWILKRKLPKPSKGKFYEIMIPVS